MPINVHKVANESTQKSLFFWIKAIQHVSFIKKETNKNRLKDMCLIL